MSKEKPQISIIQNPAMLLVAKQISTAPEDAPMIVQECISVISKPGHNLQKVDQYNRAAVAGLVTEIMVRRAIRVAAVAHPNIDPSPCCGLIRSDMGGYLSVNPATQQPQAEYDAIATTGSVPFVVEVKSGRNGLHRALQLSSALPKLRIIANHFGVSQVGYGVVGMPHILQGQEYQDRIHRSQANNIICMTLPLDTATLNSLIAQIQQQIAG